MKPPEGWKRLPRADHDSDGAITEEIAGHYQALVDRHLAQGRSPEEAAALAQREFGSSEKVLDACQAVQRRRGRAVMLSAWVGDIGLALRNLYRKPGFSLPVLLILSLGLAVAFSAWSVIDAYLWRSLPFPGAERLMQIDFAVQTGDGAPPIPDGLFQAEWPAEDELIEAVASWDLDGFTLIGDDRPENIPGAWITPGFFDAIGVELLMGRHFTVEEARDAVSVAIISHRLWTTRFGRDPEILGRSITAFSTDRPDEAEQFTVVGVLPEDFWHLNRFTDLLAPLRGPRFPYHIRVREGVLPEQVAAHLTAVARSQLDTDPAWRIGAEPSAERYVEEARPALTVLGAISALILLIVWANIGVLLLVREIARSKDRAIRSALGGRRADLVRQSLAEGLTVSTLAGTMALVLAWLVLEPLGAGIERSLGLAVPGGVAAFMIDGRVMALALTTVAASGTIFTVVPLVLAPRINPWLTLADGSARSSESRGRRRLRSFLVGVEIALSLALLLTAGVLMRSAGYLRTVDMGFDTRVLQGNITLRQRSYDSDEKTLAFVDRYLPRAAAVPGVAQVALANSHPMRIQAGSFIDIEGAAEPSALPRAVPHAVTPGYFGVLGIPLLAGRLFAPSDGPESEPVVIVSEQLAQRLWPGQSAVGQRLRRGGWRGMGSIEDEPWRTVVGVVGNTRQSVSDEPLGVSYVPFHQSPRNFMYLLASTEGSVEQVARALEQELWQIDQAVPLTEPSRMELFVERSTARPTFVASVASALAIFAVILALLGLYGVVAFAVAARRQEMAIRLALGARGDQIQSLVLRQGAMVMVLGIVAGLAGAAAMTSLVESQIHGIARIDFATYASLTVALVVAAAGAMWLPARRAGRTDPAAALRSD